jgi:hypothetical protein
MQQQKICVTNIEKNMQYITPAEASVQQGQNISFNLKHSNAQGINLDRLFLSYKLDYGEAIGEAQHFAYNGRLSLFSELQLRRGAEERLHYPHYNLLSAFVTAFLRDIDYESHNGSQFISDPVLAINDDVRLSRNQFHHERLVIVPNGDTAIISPDFEVMLTVSNDWETFTSTTIANFRPNIKISDVRLYYEDTPLKENKKCKVFSVQHQFLTNTTANQTIHLNGNGAEHYLFAINQECVRHFANLNFFQVPNDERLARERVAGAILPFAVQSQSHRQEIFVVCIEVALFESTRGISRCWCKFQLHE